MTDEQLELMLTMLFRLGITASEELYNLADMWVDAKIHDDDYERDTLFRMASDLVNNVKSFDNTKNLITGSAIANAFFDAYITKSPRDDGDPARMWSAFLPDGTYAHARTRQDMIIQIVDAVEARVSKKVIK